MFECCLSLVSSITFKQRLSVILLYAVIVYSSRNLNIKMISVSVLVTFVMCCFLNPFSVSFH